MVARPHHATLAKAEKLGFEIHGEAHDETYTLVCAEHSFTLTGRLLPELVEDAKLARMLSIEYGFAVIQTVDGWTLKKGRKTVGQGATLDEAWAKAQDALAPKVKAKEQPKKARRAREDEESEEGDEEEAEDEESEEGAGKSIVKRKYREAYKPFKATCGDDFQEKMRAHLTVKDEHDKKDRIDLDKLRALAECNEVWDDKYSRLNPGQQRMNIGNRLRARVKKGLEVVWPGPVQPAKPRARKGK